MFFHVVQTRRAAFKLHQKHSQQAASTNVTDRVNSNEARSLSPGNLWWVAWAIRIQDVIIDHKRLYIRYRSYKLQGISIDCTLILHPWSYILFILPLPVLAGFGQYNLVLWCIMFSQAELLLFHPVSCMHLEPPQGTQRSVRNRERYVDLPEASNSR